LEGVYLLLFYLSEPYSMLQSSVLYLGIGMAQLGIYNIHTA